MRGLASALAALLLVAGCASLDAPLRAHLASEERPLRECALWFAKLDARVGAAGVRDAQEARIAGFPYLRVNRLLAALAPSAASDPGAMRALVERLSRLDQAARAAEIANLPEEDIRTLSGGDPDTGRGRALARTRECAGMLRAADLAQPESRRQLLERARVPDDYSTAQRVWGLYALTRIPFAEGVRRWEAETRAAFARGAPVAGGVSVLRYAPPEGRAVGREVALGLIATADANPLHLAEPSAADREALFAAYAPIFEVEQGGDYDRFGRLRWRPGRAVPSVDASDPVVYGQVEHTLYRGQPLLQLVYTIWFAARPAEGSGDLLAGELDGVVWRVTLAPDGEPLAYDSIHACGCFHMFFPTSRAHVVAAPDGLEEWAFVPQALGRVPAQARPVVRIASRTHYIQHVAWSNAAGGGPRYTFRAYDELRSLAFARGRRSAFGPDALVAGSERAERYFFWPMGIASAGAMRQWGRQATAFVGRRHFDDADLFDRRFVFDLK